MLFGVWFFRHCICLLWRTTSEDRHSYWLKVKYILFDDCLALKVSLFEMVCYYAEINSQFKYQNFHIYYIFIIIYYNILKLFVYVHRCASYCSWSFDSKNFLNQSFYFAYSKLKIQIQLHWIY